MNFQRARSETPGCEEVLHFNNAGASLMPQPVIDAVSEHFQLEVLRGGYEAGDINADKIKRFYTSAAQLIGAAPDEIAFSESATRAWDMVAYALPFKKGDVILTVEAEYASNYIALLHIAQKTGAVIDVVPNDETGQLSLAALEEKITDRVKMITLPHIPSQGGLINPAEAVGALAKKHNIFYLLDATQSVGQMPIDVEKIGCSALCATGRKYLRGPRGTGFLYVRKAELLKLDPPFLDLYAAIWTSPNTYEVQKDATRFETWERNYGNMIGLGAAIDYAMQWGMDAIWERILHLSTLLRKMLGDNPRIALHDLGKNKCGLVTFTVEGIDSLEVKRQLLEKGINVFVSKAEYARLDLQKRGLESVVRASVHYYNTEEEIERFCEALKK